MLPMQHYKLNEAYDPLMPTLASTAQKFWTAIGGLVVRINGTTKPMSKQDYRLGVIGLGVMGYLLRNMAD